MHIAQEYINKPVITVEEGQEIGKVRDFYLDQTLTRTMAIYLGSEGLLNTTENLIEWTDVVTLGQDAILVKDVDSVKAVTESGESARYLRRDEISDRAVDTPGGTKIGHIGDIVLDDMAKIVGFSLSKIRVTGPIATNRAIDRTSIIDIGDEDGIMTADLSEAEQANLQVVTEGFFGEPSVNTS